LLVGRAPGEIYKRQYCEVKPSHVNNSSDTQYSHVSMIQPTTVSTKFTTN